MDYREEENFVNVQFSWPDLHVCEDATDTVQLNTTAQRTLRH